MDRESRTLQSWGCTELDMTKCLNGDVCVCVYTYIYVQYTYIYNICTFVQCTRFPWFARRSNQSILKEISSEYSSEGLMLQLNLLSFGHLIGRADSLEKNLMLGKIEGKRRRGRQRMRLLDGVNKLVYMSLSHLWDMVKDLKAQLAAVFKVRHN